MDDPQIDTDLIDETVLALMYLTLHGDKRETRAWKSFDWGSLARLHAKELISDPIGKAKSVVVTEEGVNRSKEGFFRIFARR